MPFIGYHITNQGIATSQGQTITEPPFLGYLIDSYPDSVKVFYDLDAAVSSLAKLIELSEAEAHKLLDDEKLYLAPYRLTYFPGRFFSVDRGFHKGHDFATFPNMHQAGYSETHYTETNSLDDAVRKAKQAVKTAEAVAVSFDKLGIDRTSLSSPISTFLRRFPLDLPTSDNCPDEASQMAWEAAKGGWTEVYTIGTAKGYDYDINGSYAYELSVLPDLRHGQWIRAVWPRVPAEAALGFACGELTTDANLHPFMCRIGEGNFTPTGSYPNTLALCKLKLMEKYNLGTFKATDGWWFVPNANKFPYAGVIKWLWDKRVQSEGRDREIIQRLYSGLYGRTLMTTKSKGKVSFADSFNPVYGATIEAETSCKVAEACLEHSITPLAILVDGFISDSEVPLLLSTELGGWKLSHTRECIIAGSTAIAFEGKDTVGGELALSYDWLRGEIQKGPNKSEYVRAKWSPTTIAEALATDYAKLGQVNRAERSVIIGGDIKRAFAGKPKTGADLLAATYPSSPWPYSFITGEFQGRQQATMQRPG